MAKEGYESWLFRMEDVGYAPPGRPPVLKNASFSLSPGEIIWLTGDSGAGKSTLLRLMNRLISPQTGQLYFQGKNLTEWPPTVLRRRVALLPQVPVLLQGSLEYNLLLPLRLKAAGGATIPSAADLSRMMEMLGLEGLDLAAPAEELSVGQKQRVCLSRLLLTSPSLLLLDEPLASLDPDSCQLVESRLADFAQGGGTVVLVSHQPARNARRRFVLENGRLAQVTS